MALNPNKDFKVRVRGACEVAGGKAVKSVLDLFFGNMQNLSYQVDLVSKSEISFSSMRKLEETIWNNKRNKVKTDWDTKWKIISAVYIGKNLKFVLSGDKDMSMEMGVGFKNEETSKLLCYPLNFGGGVSVGTNKGGTVEFSPEIEKEMIVAYEVCELRTVPFSTNRGKLKAIKTPLDKADELFVEESEHILKYKWVHVSPSYGIFKQLQ
jgi:hypothetical protein